MKKYLILAVVTLLAVLLSACSGNVKSNDTSAENTTVQVSTSVNETAQTSNAELPKIYNPTNVEIRDNEDENKVIIESSQIEYVCLLDDINGMVLNMKLTADGTDKFADYTKNNIGSAVRFVINGKTVSNSSQKSLYNKYYADKHSHMSKGQKKSPDINRRIENCFICFLFH